MGTPAAYFEGEFGEGVDGLVNYLDSVDVEAFFPTVLIPIYVEHVWAIEMTGTVEVPMIAFSCGGDQIVLDYEPLVQALLVAHARTEDVIEAIGTGDITKMLDVAGVALAASSTQSGDLLLEPRHGAL